MKLFENSSKSEEAQKELEAVQLRTQLEQERLELEKERLEFEKARQESFEKKLDELILVEKAVYTILKQEREDRQAAYERLENQLQAATSEIISTQEKAVKVMIAFNRDDNQNMTSAINEEVVKVQRVVAIAQKHLLSAAEELNNSITENTTILGNKLSALESSTGNINVSVAAVPTATEETTAYVPEEDFESVTEEDVAEDIFAVVDDEEEVPVEEDIMFVQEPEEMEIPEPEIEPEPIVVEAPVIDDPNRAMTPDEIAALIASVGGSSEAEEEVPEPELEIEAEPEPIPEPEPEPIVVEAPVMDDPNRAMSADEIAALFAAANGGGSAPMPEPEPEPEPIVVEAPVMDDPNRAMSADEIAALFAAANGGGSAPMPEPEPEPEPVVVEAPVIDDPNRAMTPDEIAALIASMN